MPKGKEKTNKVSKGGGRSSKQVNQHNMTEVNEPDDLVEPSNGKQNRNGKQKDDKITPKSSKRKIMLNENSGNTSTRKSASKSPAVQDQEEIQTEESEGNSDEEEEGELDLSNEKITIFENDETVEMTVGQDDFLTDEEGGEMAKRQKLDTERKVVRGKGLNQNQVSNQGLQSQGDTNVSQSGEETEVFFNTNTNDSNSGKGSQKNKERNNRLSLSDFADECEIMQTEDEAEEASMRKFTSFLECNGYIKKINVEGETECICPSTSKAGTATQDKSRPGNVSESEVMIYRNALPMDMGNEVGEKVFISNEK